MEVDAASVAVNGAHAGAESAGTQGSSGAGNGVPSDAADVLLVALMTVSSLLRARRAMALVDAGVWQVRAQAPDLGPRALLEVTVDVLSLLGSLLSEKLRHSQGLYSLSQCVADCITLCALLPMQRVATLATYVMIFVGGSLAYATGALHSLGWSCAWVMAAGSFVLVGTDLFAGAAPPSTIMLPGTMPQLLIERGCAAAAYCTYLGMLVYDDAQETGEDRARAVVGLLAAVPMFWPWFMNVFGALLMDCHLIGGVLLRASAAAPRPDV